MTDILQNQWVYIAPDNFLKETCRELETVTNCVENLIFSPAKNLQIAFAQDIWIDPQMIHFESIKEAATHLRRQGKYWFHYPVTCIRRATLITEQLAKLPDLKLSFPPSTALPPIGCFSLLDQHTLILANQRTKTMPAGIYQFIEDKKGPPNRAYLKLWEAFCMLDIPKEGDFALDLGASPGGWSHVLHSLKVNTLAIDKAPLEKYLMASPYIQFRQGSAFSLEPSEFDHIDWLCSDIACYPNRLYTLICKWLQSNKVKNMICTIKLQGETDLSTITDFKQIPHSRILHLYHNKHELTFLYSSPL